MFVTKFTKLIVGTALILGLVTPTYAQKSLAAIDGTAINTGLVTCGSATGVTCTDYSNYLKVVVARTAFVCNAATCDVTLATIPAKTKLTAIIADLTQTFACTATCVTATLSLTAGKTAGGNEYILSLDGDAATGAFGLTAATTGASLVANIAQGGDVPSWSAPTTIQTRFTSAVGNIGNGSATNLSQGSVTFYIGYWVFQ